MRKLLSRTALIVIILGCFSYASAQDGQVEFKMPCPQVIRFGPDKFADAYGKKMEDYSTAGQKAAFAYYVSCKRPANDELASKLLYSGRNLGQYEAQRSQLEDVRDQLNKFGEALWSLRYYEEGGGTMWALVGSAASAGREDFMETLIRALAGSEAKSPRARRITSASLARAERWLASPKRKPFIEYSDAAEVAEHKKQYEAAMAETKEALTQLRASLKDLPDLPAQRLAVQIAEETKAALADSP
jgi:cell division protein FtsB